MKNIYQIGCGAVGCEFLKELSKVCISQQHIMTIYVYDFDNVEERNVASQSFNYKDIGKNKAEVAAEQYSNPYCVIVPINKKVVQEDLSKLNLDSESIVVDAVDNMETRKILWFLGFSKKVPVLHLGLGTNSTGVVGWNYGIKNGYVFDFMNMPASQFEALKEKNIHLPPCELNAFRSIIASVGICGAVSVSNYYGISSSGPLLDWCLEKKIGTKVEGLCAAYRIDNKSVEFKKAPYTFYAVNDNG